MLGACNPQLAHRVLQTDLEVGAPFPGNLIVSEGDDESALVLAIDPTQAIATANPPFASSRAR